MAQYSVDKGQAFRTKLIYFENDREFPGELALCGTTVAVLR